MPLLQRSHTNASNLMIVLMIVMSVGAYINSYFLMTFAFLMIVIYKLFSYQIDLLLFPLMVKNE